MISVDDKYFHEYTSILNFLYVCNQRAMNMHKYYYIQLLMEGLNRIYSTSWKPHKCYIGLKIKATDSVHMRHIQKNLPNNAMLVRYKFIYGTISGSHIMYDK